MRDVIIKTITEAAREDHSIMFLSSDFGAPALDEFRQDLPNQFINVGIAEQNMIDVAAGLTLSGKKVFCYAMAPFITSRAYEQIKCSLSSMNLPVTLIGVGVGLGYDHSSMTHVQVEDLACMRTISHLEILTPVDKTMARVITKLALEKPALRYIRVERLVGDEDYTSIYLSAKAKRVCELGLGRVDRHRWETDVLIVTWGDMIRVALRASRVLKLENDLVVGVVDMVKAKPMDGKLLEVGLSGTKALVFVEEHVMAGGIGSAIMDSLIDCDSELRHLPIRRMGIEDGYKIVNGDRKYLRKHFGIDEESIVKAIRELV